MVLHVLAAVRPEGAVWGSAGEPRADMAAYYAFGEEGGKAGVLGDEGVALQPTSTATTVRARDGETLTTDGPFAESKEQLGGYYLLTCDNLDQAIEWAAKIPAAKHDSIEVRPIMEFPEQ